MWTIDAVAKSTLNAPKIAEDGLQALKWWKEGRLMEIAEDCRFDVKITKELHEYGKQPRRSLVSSTVWARSAR